MNIIFLDIDGVMNHRGGLTFPWKGKPFHPDHIPHLKKILDNTDAMVVLSSTWRYGKSISEIKEWFTLSGLDSSRVLSTTPILSCLSRWDEIRTWIRAHPEVENFVILDDENLVGNTKHIQTSFEIGLQEQHADKAIEILRR